MRKLYFILSILFSLQSFSFNDSIVRFSSAINKNITEYISKSNQAYLKKDYREAESLLDSLIYKNLIGTQFDGFSFKRIGKKRIQIDESISTPVMIFTYASWCLIEKGEIPALNKLANEFKGKIKIIVVFWDTKNRVKKIAKKFNSHIEVCYANEKSNKDLRAIKLLKNTLGFPTSYFLDSNKNIVSIKKRSSKPTYKIDFATSLKNNYNSFKTEVSQLIIRDTFQDYRIAKK